MVDVAHDMMLSLVTLGYQKLGLTDETRELRDLEDARLAIDLLRGVMDVVGAATSEQMVAPFRSTLATMQLNFARVAVPPGVADEAPAAEAIATTPAADAAEATSAAEPAGTAEPKPAAASDRRRRASEGAAEDPAEVADGDSPPAGGEPDASDQGA